MKPKFKIFQKIKFRTYYVVFLILFVIAFFWVIFTFKNRFNKKNLSLILEAKKTLAYAQASIIEAELTRLADKEDILVTERNEIINEIERVREISNTNKEEITDANIQYLDQYFTGRGL